MEKGRKEHASPSSPAPAFGGAAEDKHDRPRELQRRLALAHGRPRCAPSSPPARAAELRLTPAPAQPIHPQPWGTHGRLRTRPRCTRGWFRP